MKGASHLEALTRTVLQLDFLTSQAGVLAPAVSELEGRLCPAALEGESGVEDGQGGGGADDHDTFKDHEEDLVVGESATEALLEFGATVDGTDENGEDGYSESCGIGC